MHKNRPAIPAPAAREVRRRCGFGCVVCGCPIFHIHHIDEWATTHRHDYANLTLLCGTCHDKATKGLTSPESIREANDEPHNRKRGMSSTTELHFKGTSCRFIIGNCHFHNSGATDFFAAVVIDKAPVIGFRFEDGHLLLNARICNRFNEPVLIINDGLLAVSTEAWDVVFEGSVVTVREAKGRILLQVGFDPPSVVRVVRGFFLLNGIAVAVSEYGIKCLNSGSILSDCDLASNGYGVAYGTAIEGVPGAMGTPPIDRYPWLELEKSPSIDELWMLTRNT